MKTILDRILRRTRVQVKENERAIVLRKGEMLGILGPGEHALAGTEKDIGVYRHDLSNPAFASVFEKALFDKLPDVAARHLTTFRTGRQEVAVIERDGMLHAVLAPDRKLTVWTDAGPWAGETIDVSGEIAVDPALARRLLQAKKAELVAAYAIADGQAGLLSIDGAFVRVLGSGVHAFWNVGRAVTVKIIDLKRQPLDVAGQEMLTRDRVTIRVNISAEYQVVDPVKAATTVKDFQEALYRSLQYAYRRALGNLTLDQILERKGSVDEEAAAKVRADIEPIGVEASDIALKDVILPGDMREILNQVVAAEKQAEANVIRRREETNATRSLLNTAKVMAENPVMLRLKELETLETIAGKVERLTVHNGTDGLMNDLVRLRDA